MTVLVSNLGFQSISEHYERPCMTNIFFAIDQFLAQNEDCVVKYSKCQWKGDLCLKVDFTDGESEEIVLFLMSLESCIFKGAFETEPKRSVTATSPDCPIRSSSDLHVSFHSLRLGSGICFYFIT